LRTKPHIIDRELQRVQDANTLEEIHIALEETGRNLQQLGIFSRVDMLVSEDPEDDPEGCTVRVDLQEKNWYKVHAATYIQGGESSFETGFGLHNASGSAEHVVATAEYGTENSSQFSLSYEQPRPAGLPLTVDARLQQYLRNYQKASSFTETMRGGVVSVKSMDGAHSLAYELGWRKLADPTRLASRAVLAQTGDYLKSALRYSFFFDRRNSPASPTAGYALKSSSELAGLGPGAGATQYARQQLDAQVLVPVTPALTLSVTASAGVMLPWGGDAPLSRATCIADRFFLGGPSTLRGFKFKGAGPTDLRRPQRSEGGADAAAVPTRRDALGGDLYTSLFAALTWQLPHKAAQALRIHTHAFVNGGNCVQVAGTGKSMQDTVREFGQTFRWSAGVGLVLPTWFGRFEANYVHVLTQQEHDRVKRGMQVGFASSAFM